MTRDKTIARKRMSAKLLASASGTSQVYPTWEAKEVADAIDRIRRNRLSSGTILEGSDRLPV
jgi:hypothetical protein